MAFDVKLHVLDHKHYRLDDPESLLVTEIFPHSVLEMGRDYAVLGQVVDLSSYHEEDEAVPLAPTIPSQPLPDGVAIYLKEDDTPPTRKNAWGSELVWAMAKDLAQVELSGYPGEVNAGVKAYLGAICGETSVVINMT